MNYAAIGIGGFTDNRLRKSIYINLKKIGFQVISVIHPTASISRTVLMGEGNIVFSGVVINPYARLGNNIIVATGSTIDHDSIIKDHSLISAGVTVGAEVIIEEEVLLALGSKVISQVSICSGSLIGAGAVVNKDVPDYALMVGVPSKQIGWMSEYGEKLDLPVLGSAQTTCKHTGQQYQLKNDKLIVSNK